MRLVAVLGTVLCMVISVSTQGNNGRQTGTGRGNNRFTTFNRDELADALGDFGADIPGVGAGARRGNNGRRAGLTDFFGFLRGRLNRTVVPDSDFLPRAAPAPPTRPGPGETTLTVAHLNGITKMFRDMFSAEPEKIAPYVQMVFHLCVGAAGCDGCLDTSQPDNKRLIPRYAELRRMYETWKSVLSLADFGVLAGYAAIKHGVEEDRTGCNFGQCTISLEFTAGRRTCANPDRPPTVQFPHGDDTDTPVTFVMRPFSLTPEQTVALIGCHSVGASHINVSGFEGDWDLTPNTLDNGIFQALKSVAKWEQRFMPAANASQWNGRSQRGRSLLMLQSDMILRHDIVVEGPRKTARCSNGRPKPKLDVRECPIQNLHRFGRIVDTFADDQEEFLTHLATGTVKMCNTANFDPAKERVFVD